MMAKKKANLAAKKASGEITEEQYTKKMEKVTKIENRLSKNKEKIIQIETSIKENEEKLVKMNTMKESKNK